MGKIPIGTRGVVRSGKNAGMIVEVVQSKDTGGFLIMKRHDTPHGPIYDSWVEDIDALEKYFGRSGWDIKWN